MAADQSHPYTSAFHIFLTFSISVTFFLTFSSFQHSDDHVSFDNFIGLSNSSNFADSSGCASSTTDAVHLCLIHLFLIYHCLNLCWAGSVEVQRLVDSFCPCTVRALLLCCSYLQDVKHLQITLIYLGNVEGSLCIIEWLESHGNKIMVGESWASVHHYK